MSINFDANAFFGLIPEIIGDLQLKLPILHNPSSNHVLGQQSRSIVERARIKLIEFLSLPKDWQVVFTSGATEANNLAVSELCRLQAEESSSRKLLLLSEVEHPSVLEPIRAQKCKGFEVAYLPVTRELGITIPDPLVERIGEVAFVSLMLANNETGSIFDLQKLVREVRSHNTDCYIHVDAVQALGKIRADEFIEDLIAVGVDAFSFSGHKIGALSGVGALVFNPRVGTIKGLLGGAQETHRRAGTENVLAIHSLYLALEHWQTNGDKIRANMLASRDLFLQDLTTKIKRDVEIITNSNLASSLVNTLNVQIVGVMADDLLVSLDSIGICASAGSACASGKPDPSHVLLALGLTSIAVKSSVRFSFTGLDSLSEISEAAHRTRQIIEEYLKICRDL